jgi:protein involved in ribonucleotide reduction
MLFEFELQGTQWDVEDARAILEELDRQLAHAHGEEPAKQSIA